MLHFYSLLSEMIERKRSRPDNHLPDLTGFISKESRYPIAQGSFGDVWKCNYEMSESDGKLEVAVKSLRIDVANDNFRAICTERLLADYNARKQLHHKNLLTPLGFTYEFGLLPAIVYPWMHNGSLTTYLERHSTELTKEQKLRILRQVAAAIRYLHSKGIVHGNLTANNILIDSDHNAHVTYDGILPWAVPKLYGEPEDEKSSTPQPASDLHSLECITHQVMNA